jgi:predicted kinase
MTDINTPELVITIGLPASGKTTWADEFIQNNKNYVNVNRDDIRLMLSGRAGYNKFSKQREDMVTTIQKSTAALALTGGRSVIVSDTNLNVGRNANWMNFAHEHGATFREKLFTDTPLGVCLERDKAREYPVGQKVIEGMYNSYRSEWWDAPEYVKGLPDAYIVDIDGTVAQMNGRGPFDWKKVKDDLPKQDVIDIIRALNNAGNNIIMVSGRDGSCKKDTEEWLNDNGIGYIHFYIRPAGDSRKDTLIKEEIYHKHIKGKYNVKGVFDDRDQVVHMWRHYGLTVMQVNYGAF